MSLKVDRQKTKSHDGRGRASVCPEPARSRSSEVVVWARLPSAAMIYPWLCSLVAPFLEPAVLRGQRRRLAEAWPASPLLDIHPTLDPPPPGPLESSSRERSYPDITPPATPP